MVCQECNADTGARTDRCENCGAELTLSGNRPKEENSATNIPEIFYKAAIGPKNTDFYLSRFSHFDSGNARASWNWPAFFVTFWWLLYRKMWLSASLYIICFVVVVVILDKLTSSPLNAYLALSGIFLWIPISANALYHRHLKKLILFATTRFGNNEGDLKLIASKGGTSNAGLAIGVVTILAGIIAVVGPYAYDIHVMRSMVADGIGLSESYRDRIAEYAKKNRAWPQSNADIGITEKPNSKNVKDISIEPGGVIKITFRDDGRFFHSSVLYAYVSLTPERNGDVLKWRCYANINLTAAELPPQCR